MKKAFCGAALAALIGGGSAVSADTFVNGYMRRDGTYVQPHYRSNPDGWGYNNYSTPPNINPYTGQGGYSAPARSYGFPAAPQPVMPQIDYLRNRPPGGYYRYD